MKRHPRKKFQKPWIGPLQVEHCMGPTNYQVRDLDHNHKWNVHYNRLKPVHYNPDDDPPTTTSTPTPATSRRLQPSLEPYDVIIRSPAPPTPPDLTAFPPNPPPTPNPPPNPKT